MWRCEKRRVGWFGWGGVLSIGSFVFKSVCVVIHPPSHRDRFPCHTHIYTLPQRGPYHGKTYPDSLTYEPEESEVWRTHEVCGCGLLGKRSRPFGTDGRVVPFPFPVGNQHPQKIQQQKQLQRVYREQSRFWTTGKRRALQRWLLTALLGVLIGCIGVGMTYATGRLVGYKFRSVTGALSVWAFDW